MLADATSNGNGLYLVGKCAVALGGTPTLRFLANEVRAELTLPLVKAEAGLLPAAMRVACVDDSSFTREMDALAFAELGVEAFMRGETPEEIQTFPEFVASLDPPPNLVILDYRLDHPTLGTPFMLGTSLLHRLRELGYDRKAIIKSANDSSADVARFKADGADDAIAKGLSVDALGRELARVMGGGPVAAVDSSVLAGYSAPFRRLAVRRFRETVPTAVAAAFVACELGDAVWGHVHRRTSARASWCAPMRRCGTFRWRDTRRHSRGCGRRWSPRWRRCRRRRTKRAAVEVMMEAVVAVVVEATVEAAVAAAEAAEAAARAATTRVAATALRPRPGRQWVQPHPHARRSSGRQLTGQER